MKNRQESQPKTRKSKQLLAAVAGVAMLVSGCGDAPEKVHTTPTTIEKSEIPTQDTSTTSLTPDTAPITTTTTEMLREDTTTTSLPNAGDEPREDITVNNNECETPGAFDGTITVSSDGTVTHTINGKVVFEGEYPGPSLANANTKPEVEAVICTLGD